MAGNTNDSTTLQGFLERIEDQYGRSERGRVMDRGIPIEETLRVMRTAPSPPYTTQPAPAQDLRPAGRAS
jgi:hypothetical protein